MGEANGVSPGADGCTPDQEQSRKTVARRGWEADLARVWIFPGHEPTPISPVQEDEGHLPPDPTLSPGPHPHASPRRSFSGTRGLCEAKTRLYLQSPSITLMSFSFSSAIESLLSSPRTGRDGRQPCQVSSSSTLLLSNSGRQQARAGVCCLITAPRSQAWITGSVLARPPSLTQVSVSAARQIWGSPSRQVCAESGVCTRRVPSHVCRHRSTATTIREPLRGSPALSAPTRRLCTGSVK